MLISTDAGGPSTDPPGSRPAPPRAVLPALRGPSPLRHQGLHDRVAMQPRRPSPTSGGEQNGGEDQGWRSGHFPRFIRSQLETPRYHRVGVKKILT